MQLLFRSLCLLLNFIGIPSPPIVGSPPRPPAPLSETYLRPSAGDIVGTKGRTSGYVIRVQGVDLFSGAGETEGHPLVGGDEMHIGLSTTFG